jgi:hypothetical protein
MDFKNFKQRLQNNFKTMTKGESHLFRVNADADVMWELYLDSFLPEYNKIFRERREHDCSCCKSFIRHFGDVVSIKDNKIISIWDFPIEDSEEYKYPVLALRDYIKSREICDIFISKEKNIGTDFNIEMLDSGKTIKWEHFFIKLDDKFVDKSNQSINEITGGLRDIRNVLKRSLDEISMDAITTVMDLIKDNSLYRGDEWRNQLQTFLKIKFQYDVSQNKDLYAWKKSTELGIAVSKIKNHSIGTLLLNISEGMNLELAIKKYESIVAPENYKRPKPIFTEKMLNDAKSKIEELGYMKSLERRFASLEDITINNVIFANKDSSGRISNDIFLNMADEVTSVNPDSIRCSREVDIETFIKDIVPNVTAMECFLDSSKSKNFVSLIAPKDLDSKSMFKWDNNFSWAYTGNLADSMIKKNVEKAGGDVSGILRFSIQWNEDGDTNDDFDAHCVLPNGHQIYFANKKDSTSTGELDVDIINPKGDVAVENITFQNIRKMSEGKYRFIVHNYNKRDGKSGFKAEVEFNNQIYQFEYPHRLRDNEYVDVAEVNLSKEVFTIKPLLKATTTSKEIWNLKTNRFIPVYAMMYSPNFWDGQSGIGNKHYMFMLKNCINPESPNPFFNEFLKEELNPYRKVFEAIGNKMALEINPNQLSGLGFSSTQRNDIVVKITSPFQQIVKIKI